MSTTKTLAPSGADPSVAPESGPRRGFYERRVLPRILDSIMDTEETRWIRARVCAPLVGSVLEIGFGTGHNLPYLPDDVRQLLAVEPIETGRRLGAAHIDATSVPIEFVGSDAQRLPLPDGSVDAVLSTWTLCSIEDPVAAVREIVRVLQPGARLHFVEHGRSPDARTATWQRRLNPLYRRISCGCNLDRDIPAILAEGGMAVEALATYLAAGDPKVLGWTFEGRAVAGTR